MTSEHHHAHVQAWIYFRADQDADAHVIAWLWQDWPWRWLDTLNKAARS